MSDTTTNSATAMVHANPCCKSLQEALDVSENKRQRLRRNLGKLKAKIIDTSSLIGLYKESQTQLQQAQEQSASLNASVTPLKAKVHALSVQLKTALETNTELRNQLHAKDRDIEQIQAECQQAQGELAAVQVYNDQLLADHKSCPSSSQYAKMEKENGRLTKDLTQKESTLRIALKTQGAMKLQIGRLNKALEEAKKKIQEAPKATKTPSRNGAVEREAELEHRHSKRKSLDPSEPVASLTKKARHGASNAVTSSTEGSGGAPTTAAGNTGSTRSTPRRSVDNGIARGSGTSSRVNANADPTQSKPEVIMYGPLRAPRPRESIAGYLTACFSKVTSVAVLNHFIEAVKTHAPLNTMSTTQDHPQLVDTVLSCIEQLVSGAGGVSLPQRDGERILARVLLSLCTVSREGKPLYHDAVDLVLQRLSNLATDRVVAIQKAVSACRVVALVLGSETDVSVSLGGVERLQVLLCNITYLGGDTTAQLARYRAIICICPNATACDTTSSENDLLTRALMACVALRMVSAGGMKGAAGTLAQACVQAITAQVKVKTTPGVSSDGSAQLTLYHTLQLTPVELDEEFIMIVDAALADLQQSGHHDNDGEDQVDSVPSPSPSPCCDTGSHYLSLIAIQLVCAVRGWEWTYNEVIVTRLHVLLQNEDNVLPSAAVMHVIEVLGSLVRIGVRTPKKVGGGNNGSGTAGGGSGGNDSRLRDPGVTYVREKLLALLSLRNHQQYSVQVQASAARALLTAFVPSSSKSQNAGTTKAPSLSTSSQVARTVHSAVRTWFASLTNEAKLGLSSHLTRYLTEPDLVS